MGTNEQIMFTRAVVSSSRLKRVVYCPVVVLTVEVTNDAGYAWVYDRYNLLREDILFEICSRLFHNELKL